MVVANITTMLRYSGLVVASHPGLQSIGYLAMARLAATLVAALLVLPSALEVAGSGLHGRVRGGVALGSVAGIAIFCVPFITGIIPRTRMAETHVRPPAVVLAAGWGSRLTLHVSRGERSGSSPEG